MSPKTEPVMTLVLALIGSVVGLLVAFGVQITEAQAFALGNFAQAAIGLGLWVRSQVTPKARAASQTT